MGKIFKSKKVIAALVALAVALVSVGLGTDVGAGTTDAVVGVICQVVTCS
ncbi:MAG: hypothetical protein [Caudoviricetes sp.]|nr:MAG: hypothetical protein [Caudoviricetes sp.]